ncbi:MAG: type II toxin-antitoxin system RelE/ParE family toxin [Planctomycetaceae bacterium]|nr:type II toxin-antitoxin system RelE/ParE family toxin [Planctomycetaceae bacterium]
MTSPVIFRRVARAEFNDAADWYEQRRRGLGAAFTAAVEDVLERIADQPRLFPKVYKDARLALVSGYPYCVYYLEEPEQVVILAVFHTSRDPSVWQSRS